MSASSATSATPMPPLDAIPYFAPSLRVDVVRADLLLILSEHKRIALAHPLLAQVANLIDGQASVQQICARLTRPRAHEDTRKPMVSPDLNEAQVCWALQHLQQRGYVRMRAAGTVENENAENAAQAWWELFACAAPKAAPRISLQALAGLNCSAFEQALQLAQLQLQPFAESQLHVLLLDDASRPEVRQISAACRAANKPLLLVKASGNKPSIGPLLHPQMGSCVECLQFWLRQQQPLQSWLNRQQASSGHFLPTASLPSTENLIYSMAAQSLLQLFASGQDTILLRDHILSLDLKTMQSSRHKLVKRPQCPACGDAGLMARQGWQAPRLRQIQAQACQDGGFRQQDPYTTFSQYQHLINPVCGPIAYLHPMPGRHQGMRKVYVAGYLTCPEDAPYQNNFDKICAGKGHTDDQAKASALCESLERWSGVWQGDEACRRASLAELLAEGAQVHDFNALQNFSAEQFARRAQINAQEKDSRRQIPLPQHADMVLDWSPVWSLADNSMHYVPLAYCYAQAPSSAAAGCGIHNPNGSAAGVGREEAVLQAMLELVERDACAIWWYNRLPRPALQLAELDDAYARKLQAHYQDLGWQTWALDLSHDLQIPVYAALAYEADSQRYAIGFGCHLDATLALQRALTELNQLFDPSAAAIAPWDQSLLTDASFLHPTSFTSLPAQNQLKAAQLGGSNLLADIEYCRQQFAKAGIDCLLLDKTRPEIGLSVMQVIAPGLRHFWPRFGPGRLYDVPVQMGWLLCAKKEQELNPAPLFL